MKQKSGQERTAGLFFYSLYMHLKFMEAGVKADAKIYRKDPPGSSGMTDGRNEFHSAIYTSTEPLYVSMTLARGSCTMITRQKNTQTEGKYDLTGEPLINADGKDYEYLWMTVSYPGGKGVVNLAADAIRKFSDADFPHWTGWQLVDDDKDTHSQCNSAIIRKLQEEGSYEAQRSRLICRSPFEWEKSTIDARYKWLMTGLPWEQCTVEKTAVWTVPGTQETKDRVMMSEEAYDRLRQHAEALCFDSGELGSGRVWHFNPIQFINHLRTCGWLSHGEISSMIPRKYSEGYPSKPVNVTVPWATSFGRWEKYVKDFNNTCNKYNIISPPRRSAFLGQIYIETGMLRTMTEGGKGQKNSKGKFVSPAAEYYQPFYGRGFMQLTWPQNFDGYRKFRTKEKLPDETSGYAYDDSRITNVSEHYWADPRKTVTDKKTHEKLTVIDGTLLKKWHPRYDPKIIAEDSFCATDSAGFYWVSKHHSHEININRVPDNGITSASIGRCSVLVNGGGYGYFERQAYTRYVFYYLNDAVMKDTKETVDVQKGRSTVKITVDYTKQCK